MEIKRYGSNGRPTLVSSRLARRYSQSAARWDSFVSFEKLSVNNFHGWSSQDYQNIYLNCHNILKHSRVKSKPIKGNNAIILINLPIYTS